MAARISAPCPTSRSWPPKACSKCRSRCISSGTPPRSGPRLFPLLERARRCAAARRSRPGLACWSGCGSARKAMMSTTWSAKPGRPWRRGQQYFALTYHSSSLHARRLALRADNTGAGPAAATRSRSICATFCNFPARGRTTVRALGRVGRRTCAWTAGIPMQPVSNPLVQGAGFDTSPEHTEVRAADSGMAGTEKLGRGKALVMGDDTRGFLATVRSLGRKRIEVHAAPADFRSPALASRYIKAVHDLPPWLGDGPEWLAAMRALLQQERFDVVIPCDERNLLPLQRHREELSRLTQLAIPDDPAIDVLFDKHDTRELAARVGVNVAPGRLARAERAGRADLRRVRRRRWWSSRGAPTRWRRSGPAAGSMCSSDPAKLDRLLDGGRARQPAARRLFRGRRPRRLDPGQPGTAAASVRASPRARALRQQLLPDQRPARPGARRGLRRGRRGRRLHRRGHVRVQAQRRRRLGAARGQCPPLGLAAAAGRARGRLPVSLVSAPRASISRRRPSRIGPACMAAISCPTWSPRSPTRSRSACRRCASRCSWRAACSTCAGS